MNLSRVGDYDWSGGEFADYGASAPPVEFGSYYSSPAVVYEYSTPQFFTPVSSVTAPSIGGPGILDQLLKVGQSVIPMWLQTDAQRQLNEINVERAKRGQAPLNAQQYMQQMATPQMNFGLTGQTQNMVYAVAILGGGFLLIREILKPRNGGRGRRSR